METDKKYNGWTNYETWLVNLWLDQDAGGYWNEQAEEIYKRAKPSFSSDTQEQAATRDLADALKESHEQEIEEKELTGFYADLMNAALSEVNWHEIAEHYINEVAAENAK